MMNKIIIFLILITQLSIAADSVDVIFRYNYTGSNIPTVPGTFNNWNQSAWPMTKISSDLWTRTARLQIGTYLYKFYNGETIWPNDPLNHHVNQDAYQNSIIYVKDPTIYHFLPNQRNPIVNTSLPTISAYIFPKVGSEVDTSTLSLIIDDTLYTGIGKNYNFNSRQLLFIPPEPLPNGLHRIILNAGTNSDTVNFTTQGGFIQLTNRFPFDTWKSSWPIYGIVDDENIDSVIVVHNLIDTFKVSASEKHFYLNAPLVEGINSFVAVADSEGVVKVSSPIIINRLVNHAPYALINFSIASNQINCKADKSTDPDTMQTDSLIFLWNQDINNPQYINNIDGSTNKIVTITKPNLPGEYYLTLIVTDPQGNSDTTRNYFIIEKDGKVKIPTISSNPEWARKARIYFLFPKAFSQSGTINAATARLDYIKKLGFNVIWLTPVMKNAYPIDNGYGIGYNIVDFYNVAPEYGTNQDLQNFITTAHELGIKVILDITPNHTGRSHPWSVDAHTYKKNSPYWNWYQHENIPHNDNGLGQSFDADSFWYYGGFSEQLLNYNWTDLDAQTEMINVYLYWVKVFNVDGFRFDVYWGPHRRYGERYMGQPVRQALKHVKPDILLLAEDEGTGVGSETIYSDYAFIDVRGGVDAAYDFKLYGSSIVNFGFTPAAITLLHNNLNNEGYYPGENSLYMRFMESQDEDRIFYTNPSPSTYYDSNPIKAFQKTMPVSSVIFTAPGVPMLWNGQEIGWGYGISGDKIARNRSIINWDFQGKNVLIPHYQKLANIRGQFSAFTQHKRDTNKDGYITSADSSDFIRVASTNPYVYAFARPYENQSGLTVINISDSVQNTYLDLTSPGICKFSNGIEPAGLYFLNDLYNGIRFEVYGSDLDSVLINLNPYGTAIFTVSLTPDSLLIENILSVSANNQNISDYYLWQNYPNPFNPVTRIKYTIPKRSWVNISIFDILGREVDVLVNSEFQPGTYETIFNGNNFSSGIYFYKMQVEDYMKVNKMLLIK